MHLQKYESNFIIIANFGKTTRNKNPRPWYWGKWHRFKNYKNWGIWRGNNSYYCVFRCVGKPTNEQIRIDKEKKKNPPKLESDKRKAGPVNNNKFAPPTTLSGEQTSTTRMLAVFSLIHFGFDGYYFFLRLFYNSCFEIGSWCSGIFTITMTKVVSPSDHIWPLGRNTDVKRRPSSGYKT